MQWVMSSEKSSRSGLEDYVHNVQTRIFHLKAYEARRKLVPFPCIRIYQSNFITILISLPSWPELWFYRGNKEHISLTHYFCLSSSVELVSTRQTKIFNNFSTYFLSSLSVILNIFNKIPLYLLSFTINTSRHWTIITSSRETSCGIIWLIFNFNGFTASLSTKVEIVSLDRQLHHIFFTLTAIIG